ncbi:hypothetical protein K0M31_001487, partial [Melipona bicolor]
NSQFLESKQQRDVRSISVLIYTSTRNAGSQGDLGAPRELRCKNKSDNHTLENRSAITAALDLRFFQPQIEAVFILDRITSKMGRIITLRRTDPHSLRGSPCPTVSRAAKRSMAPTLFDPLLTTIHPRSGNNSLQLFDWKTDRYWLGDFQFCRRKIS